MKATQIERVLLTTIFLMSVLFTTYAQTKNEKSKDGILKIKYSHYIGKEVYTLLLNDEIRSYKDFIFIDNRPSVLAGALIKVDSTILMEIYVSKFNCIVPFSEKKKLG